MTENNTRRLVQSVLVSLNGVISEPMTWAGPYFGAGSAAHSLAALERSDAFLMGRRTYETFARQWPTATGPYADFLNRMPKYVFSSTLAEAEWDNTTVIAGEVVEGVRALKQAGGNDLVVYGHGRFGQALVDAGLVDELTLTIVPVFVSGGTALFRDSEESHRWELLRAGRGHDPGLASLTYRPATASGQPGDAPEV
ncbi:dihydrofolate reductase family protein [Kribbella sp. VKM Ac-2568]|uniref:dihydrofolate reductase family protein n=1 Tax=Kribbella sp. VKM Ac-2568 TaxID=2512219 RepID=UPI00104BC859|nr:dihydrofolate reductase family protein [Kribbella sp. VKM Ac-2568]TCM36998.1 dihydrofolate reductase [Kribbella sp. VKM Ac-2568]